MNKPLTIIRLNQPKITDFAAARNKLMQTVKAGWILFLDKDEALSADINLRKLDKRFNYRLKRQDWFLGRKLRFGETNHLAFTRLIQPNTGRWQGQVHEQFVSTLPLKTLSVTILHRRQLTLSQFLDRLNYYSSLRAQESSHFSIFELLFYPWLKFVKNYFFHLGFLDGVPGLAMAFFMSLHSLAVRVKQYETKNH